MLQSNQNSGEGVNERLRWRDKETDVLCNRVSYFDFCLTKASAGKCNFPTVMYSHQTTGEMR